MMTIEQQQHLLAYLGYYDSDVDGLWGPKSTQATKDFQTDFGGLEVTGKVDDTTAKALTHAVAYGMLKVEEPAESETFWDEIEFFDRDEFRCTCGGRGCNGFPAEPVEQLIRNAEATRKHFGKVADVSSGVRCKLRNSELPGSASNSLHMRGKAMDFRIRGVSSAITLAFVKTLPNVNEAYAIDGSYVHMGVLKYS